MKLGKALIIMATVGMCSGLKMRSARTLEAGITAHTRAAVAGDKTHCMTTTTKGGLQICW